MSFLERRSLAPLLFFVASLPAASCDAIVGAGDRERDSSIVCSSSGSGCECAEGFGDCDDDPDNGCETDFDDPENCGACGNVCENGECADGACACDEGFAECDGDPTTICEVDITGDDAHCGSCTRGCGGAGCVEGLCQPEQITGPGQVYYFTVVADEIYYAPADSAGIWHVPIAGGAPAQLDAGNDTEYAYLLIYDGGKIYWTSETRVLVTDIETGMTQTLATNELPGLRIAVGGGKVYWANIDTATNVVHIHRAPITPGGMVEDVVALLDAQFVNDFAVTPERVYWNDVAMILSSPHDSISEDPFQMVPQPPAAFEPTPDSLLLAGVPGGTYELPLAGGTVKKLADIQGYGWMTYDTDHVFFMTYVYGVSQNTTLWRASRNGDEPALELHASQGLLPYLPLSLDESHVYWLDTATGYIARIPK